MADPFPKPVENFIAERNNSSQEELSNLMRRITDYQWFDAMVTKENVDEFSNRYMINVHAGGINKAITHKDVLAICPDPRRLLLRGVLCKVIMDGRIAIIMPWTGPVRILINSALTTNASLQATPRRLQGYLGDPAFTRLESVYMPPAYKSEDFVVSMTYGVQGLYNSDNEGIFQTRGTSLKFLDTNLGIDSYPALIGYLWPSPVIVKDVDKDGEETAYVSAGYIVPEGAKIPSPSAKYQVLTCLDDALNYTWDFLRFT